MTYDPKNPISVISGVMAEQAADIIKLNEHEKQQGAEIIRPRLQTKKMSEIVDTYYPDLKQPVKDLICEGSTVFAGGSKSGKSWMALNWCMAVAAGKPFLGRETEQGNVLYLALEDSDRSLKSRLQKLSFKTGISKDEYSEYFERAIKAPTVKDGLIEMLETWIIEHPKAQLICIDVMQKVRGITPGNRNAYQDDYAYLTTFDDLAKKHRIAIVLLHHVNRRDDKSIGDPFDRISGSNGIMGTVDTAIILTKKRGQNQATMKIESRSFYTKGDDMILTFDDGLWTVISENAAEHDAKKVYDQNPVVRLIKDIMKDHPNGVTMTFADFMKESMNRYGLYVTNTPIETGMALTKIADELLLYDDIIAERYRKSDLRGLKLSKRLPHLDAMQTGMDT